MFNAYTMIFFIMIYSWYLHGQNCWYNHFKTKNPMLCKYAYIRHCLKQNKKLVVEHGNIYKFMKMMYKIQCQKLSERQIERRIKQQCQKPSDWQIERQIKEQCQKPSERQIERQIKQQCQKLSERQIEQ